MLFVIVSRQIMVDLVYFNLFEHTFDTAKICLAPKIVHRNGEIQGIKDKVWSYHFRNGEFLWINDICLAFENVLENNNSYY